MTAQQMIEEALLPVRLLNFKEQQSLAHHRTQRLDPTW
jgi:hypothetical protein